MAIQSQPSRIPEPFAGSGTKNTIPATNTTPSASQAASWASGFPPECSQPISAGGCPVPRNDVNGALNQISQDFAFRQDGGIWTWSALADYDAQRMVRGSDGLLYWSVQQSGPGLASGAVDPTTDDGTYWSSPALKTMPLSDKSAMGATTEWVKDLAAMNVYLDPAGSDSNSGMSAAEAVQTFSRALSIAGTTLHQNVRIAVSSGEYTENVLVQDLKCIFDLDGDITIKGTVALARSSVVIEGGHAVNIQVGSVDTAFAATQDSFFYSSGVVDISGSSCSTGIELRQNSTCFFANGQNVNNISASVGVYVTGNSFCFLDSGTITASSSCIVANYCSFVDCEHSASLQCIKTASSGDIIESSSGAVIVFYCNISLSATNGASRAVYVYGSGLCEFAGSTDVSITGTYSSAVVECGNNGYIYVASQKTFSGSPTGNRYYANRGGQINVGGAGANRIPGSAAGNVNSASYGFYG